MGEENPQVVAIEEFIPENADLLTLADGVRRDETNFNLSVLNVFRRLSNTTP